MAKTRYVDAPPQKDVYFGMLAVTAACMFVGIILLVIECNSYDWVTKVEPGPALNLPKLEGGPAPAGRSGTPAAPAGTAPGAAAPVPVAPRAEAAPTPAPLPIVQPPAVAIVPPSIPAAVIPKPVTEAVPGNAGNAPNQPLSNPTPPAVTPAPAPAPAPEPDRGPRPGFGPFAR